MPPSVAIAVAIVQNDMQLNISTYEVLQILSISLTDKTISETSSAKLNFNIIKNVLGLTSQVYLIFNNVPFLMGH